jgi:peroxiredoxin
MRARRTAVTRVCTALCAVALAWSLSGCTTSGDDATDGTNFVSGDGSIQLIAASDRKEAPDLAGSLVGGGQGDLSDDAGKVVVLNTWASWCGPCRKESQGLVEAAGRLATATFMGINTRDNEGNAQAFVRAEGIPYPSFSDQDGALVLQMSRVVNMSSLPVTVILDKQHRVAAAIYGPTTATTIEAIVKPLERES